MPLFNPLIRVKPELWTVNFGLKKLETSLFHVVCSIFDILNRLGMDH